ncbi:MAG: FAD-dependent oxidoreductase [Clostridiales bacterium]|nr:FAD-dependent oxidoreductase [Clostridiales bacterium]
MAVYTYTKQIPIGEEYDVIVAGAGPSGVAAAIASARTGAKTLLLERSGAPGGMWTGGLVNPLFDGENKTGIMREILTELKEQNAFGGFWNITYNFETLKGILDEKLAVSGVTVLYDTTLTDVRKEGNRVTGIVAQEKGGEVLYPCKVAVDCTGDAYLTYLSGGAYDVGGKNGECQSMTLMFYVGGVTFMQQGANDLSKMIDEAVEKYGLNYRLPFRQPYVIRIPNTDTAVVQLTHMYGVNPLSTREISQAYAEGRKQAREVFHVMKTYIPEFKDMELLLTAPMLGIRESRRIVGEYTLTVEDLVEGRKPKDSLCICTFNIDVHQANSVEQKNRGVQPYGIPYRSLIPKGLEGLLVAGKTISGSHEAMASYRVTGNCVAMGEGAGKAAALAALTCRSVRDVDINEIIPR